MKPKLRWDTSRDSLRRVRVGETISYSGSDYGRCVTHHICDCKQQELEAEVEGLRRDFQRNASTWSHKIRELEAEVERLRWFFENMHDVDRRQLQMEYEQRNKAIERAVRERQERR